MKLLSPVFTKELVTLARRKRHYFARALVVGTLLMVVWMTWRDMAARTDPSSFLDLSVLGRHLFEAFVWAQFALILLLVPALTSPVVAAERERNTLGLLLLTNLSHSSILLDKLLSRIVLVLLLVFGGLPVFLVLLAFRGVEPVEIFFVYLGTVSLLFFCCGVGLRVSTRSTTTRGALIGTYLATAGALVGVLLIFMPLLSCFAGLVYSVRGEEEILAAGSVLFAGVSAAVFILAVKRCAAILPAMSEARRVSWWKTEADRLRVKLDSQNPFRRLLLQKTRSVGRNPLLWRECHTRVNTSRLYLFFWSYTPTFLLYGFYIMWCQNPIYATVLSAMHLSVVLVLSIILSATAFAEEKEKHGFDLLLCTPQRSISFVLCKFLAVLRSVSVFACVPLILPLLCFIPVLRQDGWTWVAGLRQLALILAVFLPAVIVVGLWISARCSRSGNAIAWTFIAVGLWFLGPFAISFVAGLFGTAWPWLSAVQCLSPVAWFLDVFAPVPLGALLPMSLTATASWALALLLLVTGFDRIVGRM